MTASAMMRLPYYYRKLRSRPTYYVMKVVGRFKTARALAPHLCNRGLVKPPLNRSSVFPAVDVATTVRRLEADGLCPGIDLPSEIVTEIRAYARSQPCFGNKVPRYGFQYAKRQEAEALAGQAFVLGGYFNTEAGCPAISGLARDPKLWEIAEQYFGTVPRHIGSQLWWSFAAPRSEEEKNFYAQLYHYDLDGYAFLKFFFYLTGVDDESGPHVGVRGTHRRKILRHRMRYMRFSDAEVERCYGAENVTAMYGKAGTGFAEDTYCIHKGEPPTGRDRLILQIQFGLHDYGVQHDRVDDSVLQYVL